MITRPRRGPESIRSFTERLASSDLLRESVAYRRFVEGASASYAPLGRPFPRSVDRALLAWGVEELYSHQVEAIEAIRGGANVVAVTPTASGKSLIYMAPALEILAGDPDAKTLCLFPYKALAQDQARAFASLASASEVVPAPSVAVYDGDTPRDLRGRIRAAPPSVLITNPEMLHLGILPYHQEWRPFLSQLRLIVVDELHVYRGVFGSHLHHVVSRLRRICRHYGADPRFVACSATIGNAGEFASSLLGARFQAVERTGAPRAGRHFLFVNASQGSPYTLATRVLAEAMEAGWRTIAFTKARKITELIHSWLSQSHPHLARRVSAYRAGYLPEERREIERKLGDGGLLGVVTTSALEHGIDIGGLDVCVLVGYPGSITSSWQRIGRVGRSDRESLVVVVGLADALDQYFMRNPAEFFDRGFEAAAADPENSIIAGQHLVCAAAEIPITPADRAHYPAKTYGLVHELARSGALVADDRVEAWYSLRRNPSRDVNLRSGGGGYTIIEEPAGRTIGSVDGVRAFVECHEGAIYLHQGQQYEIARLDRANLRVEARRCEVQYYTQVLSEKETEILKVLDERIERGYVARLGEIKVTQELKEYVRRRISDQQRTSSHPLDLPPLIYETIGLWIEIPHQLQEEWAARGRHFMGSLHAAEHAAISLFPLLAICDRGDIGGISYAHHPQVNGPAVFIYDGYPGGIGLARRGFEVTAELLSRTARLIGECACEDGCPSCIHSPKCGSGNHPLDKTGAAEFLSELLKPERKRALAPAAIAPLADSSDARPGEPTWAPRPQRREIGHGSAGSGRTLFLDVETQRSAEEVGGWDRIREMGLALAVVFDASREEYRTYFERDVDRLAVHLLSADLVVGFNIKRFDYEVLRGYSDADFSRVPTLDMLEVIHARLGFRLSLGHLAEATLGLAKSADGLQSLRWYREGRLDLIEEYCRRDVEVTRGLYEFGRKHGHLVYADRQQRSVRVTLSW